MRYPVPLFGFFFFYSNCRQRKWSKSVLWLIALGFQTPPLSLSSCKRFSVSSPLFLKTFSFNWNHAACRYLRVKLQHASFQGWRWKSSMRPSGRAAFEAGPSRMCLLKPAANPVSLFCKKKKCHKGKRAHVQRFKKNLLETMSLL